LPFSDKQQECDIPTYGSGSGASQSHLLAAPSSSSLPPVKVIFWQLHHHPLFQTMLPPQLHFRYGIVN